MKTIEIIRKYGIFILLTILIVFVYKQSSTIQELRRQNANLNQNIIALNDTIRYEQLKSGSLQASIASYISTEKQLKELNSNLYKLIKEQNGKIVSLNNSIINLIQDKELLKKYVNEKETLIDEILQINENTFIAPWTLSFSYGDSNFDTFTGNTSIRVDKVYPLEITHLNTELIRRNTQINLTWGQQVENNTLRVFVRSNYPGFSVSQLEGVFIDPNTNPFFKGLMKKKVWFSGISLGIGTSVGYNLTTGKYGMVIGPTLTWNIYNF